MIFAGINSKDREGYFFSPLHAKNSYTNNGRINRSTNTGSWQAKGRDSKITSELNGEVIGVKKIFVHSCIKDGFKYVMHEFSASFDLPNCRDLVRIWCVCVCKRCSIFVSIILLFCCCVLLI